MQPRSERKTLEQEMAPAHKRNNRRGRRWNWRKAPSEMIIPLAREEKKKITVPRRLLRERKGPAAI